MSFKGYISLAEWRDKTNANRPEDKTPLRKRRVQQYAQDGRLKTCRKVGNQYIVHEDEPDPRYPGPGWPKGRKNPNRPRKPKKRGRKPKKRKKYYSVDKGGWY